jgi:diaminohydroxyphosphoribosylaminopyrimidine deaminase / 5-amino-6-(5-phosphoribosylamino)uracil reductase
VIDAQNKSLTNNHGFFMQRCLDLAIKGGTDVFPNPMVGCVVVVDGKIIAEGYHQKFGEAHAEVNALSKINDISLLEKAIVYVSLEPCSHYGKTPPCAHFLIAKGIKKVVIGCRDSFKKVDGKGIELLKASGIEVVTGILEKECLLLNERFFYFHKQKQPYVVLKWVQSKDGFFAPKNNQGIHWITQLSTQIDTHLLRSKEQAILVGVNTVLIDNPSLDVRAVAGKSPIRIVLDPKNKLIDLEPKPKIFDGTQRTIVLNSSFHFTENFAEFIAISPFTIEKCMEKLYEMKIVSILVEGGANTIQRFIDEGYWNKAYVFTGQENLSEGLKSPEFLNVYSPVTKKLENNDKLTIYSNNSLKL